jgi:hypothetical protein
MVVVHDLDIVGVRIDQPKANPPLVVDPNAMLAFAVALQRLQAIAPDPGQIGEASGYVKKTQPPRCGFRNRLKSGDWEAIEQPLGIGAAERSNHRSHHNQPLYGERKYLEAGEIHTAALSGRLPTLTFTPIFAFHFASFFRRPRFLGGLPIGSLPGGVSQ